MIDLSLNGPRLYCKHDEKPRCKCLDPKHSPALIATILDHSHALHRDPTRTPHISTISAFQIRNSLRPTIDINPIMPELYTDIFIATNLFIFLLFLFPPPQYRSSTTLTTSLLQTRSNYNPPIFYTLFAGNSM